MWLPKDERRLLQGYFVRIGEVNRRYEFSYDGSLRFIKSKETSQNVPSDSPDIEGYKAWLKDCNRIVNANRVLKERGLIISPTEEFEPSKSVIISLTLNGYDLGRKYNSWWLWIKLWYDEYIKNHPIWLIVSCIVGYIAGIISVLLVNWLSE